MTSCHSAANIRSFRKPHSQVQTLSETAGIDFLARIASLKTSITIMNDPIYRTGQNTDQSQSRARVGKQADTDISYASASHFDTTGPRSSHSLPHNNGGKDDCFSWHDTSDFHTSQPLPGSDPSFVPSFVRAGPSVLPPQAHASSALYQPLSISHNEQHDAFPVPWTSWTEKPAEEPSSHVRRRSNSSCMDELTEVPVDAWTNLETKAMEAHAVLKVPRISTAIAAQVSAQEAAAASGSRCLYRSFDKYGNSAAETASRPPTSHQTSASASSAAAWSAEANNNQRRRPEAMAFPGFQAGPGMPGHQQSRLCSDTPPLPQQHAPGVSSPFMPSIFPDCNSPAALQQSNHVMGGLVLPGEQTNLNLGLCKLLHS